MRTFRIITLGCKVNQYESEELARNLSRRGLEPARLSDRADLVIVNTCTVTSVASGKSRRTARRAGRQGAEAVVVTGCAATVEEKSLAALAGVTHVVPQEAKMRIPEILGLAPPSSGESASRPARSRAFLKVQDGCEGGCSYCVVPLARGRQRSRAPAEIMEEAGRLGDSGFKEVVLTGIRLGAYGRDLAPRSSLAEMVSELLAAGPGFRLRLSSIEPVDITRELIEIVSSRQEICPHLHVPLQSGSDRVLRRMNRPYTAAEYLEKIAAIRNSIDAPAITTDVLVGFPGESDEDFERTLDLCRLARFSRTHVFPFSPRPGTAAAAMPERCPAPLVSARETAAAELGVRMARDYAESRLGTLACAIVENKLRQGLRTGTTERYLRTLLDAPDLCPGDMVEVEIHRIEGAMVLGRLAGREGPAVRAR